MPPFDVDYEQVIDLLEKARSEEELRNVIQQILSWYGLRHYVYHAVSFPGRSDANPILMLSYPPEWVDRYVSQNYFKIDPVVAAGAVAVLPVDWGRLDRRSFHARRLFGEAAEFGIGGQGLTFPIRGASGDSALFTITSDVADAEWERLKRAYMRDFQMIAHLVHGKALEIHGGEAGGQVPVLSPRERECLQAAAEGRTNKEIAWALGISERVVRAYFETARHKLNCLNRSHVVSRAMALHLIQPVQPSRPLSTGDDD